ncbi:MAG: thioredoxin [Okeania sp. SIO3H1]|uniref:thioredoxin n=1 Tax=Okeania sp. SIO1I7 TaxID=2607772 RepID=UPI0013C643D7|nr:thioredoxin [Okeania sp. SIO1I7]NEN92796.1 thioredoxin [Okeania sp. SIO3H1]NET26495.1 thioredoxin [Okeania sp. SIO1I7]
MAIKKQFNSFDELLANSEMPVLVDFYATWCGPCQMMAPILEQVNQKMKDRLRIVKIDTDKYPQLASKYSIQALPTLVLFKNGQPVEQIEGVIQAQQLVERLENIV